MGLLTALMAQQHRAGATLVLELFSMRRSQAGYLCDHLHIRLSRARPQRCELVYSLVLPVSLETRFRHFDDMVKLAYQQSTLPEADGDASTAGYLPLHEETESGGC